MNGWQPIETSPKDGTWFIAARFGAENRLIVEVGRYNPLMSAEYEHIKDDIYRRKDRQIFDWEGFNNIGLMTHWMPLPEPPESAA